MLYVITSPKRNLKFVLSKVSAVEVGKTKLEDWRPEAQGTRIPNTFKCDARACYVGWFFENRLLAALGLSPPTLVGVTVSFQDGIASEIYIIYVVAKRDDKREWYDDLGVVIRQRPDFPAACRRKYQMDLKHRAGGDPYWVAVAMDACVSPEDRARAFAINSSCLTRIGGCKTVESMIPQIF
jgi:hypothetical protein